MREVSLAQAAACPGAANWDGSVPSSAISTRALTAPIPVISSSRSASPSTRTPRSVQSGAWPPPTSPHAVQTGAVRGTCGRSCSILASRPVISALIASISRRCTAISSAWMSRNWPVSVSSSIALLAFSR